MDMAKQYLEELNGGAVSQNGSTRVPDGNHLRVMMWLRDAVEEFRKSKLPSLGLELHVNVHESLFLTPSFRSTKIGARMI